MEQFLHQKNQYIKLANVLAQKQTIVVATVIEAFGSTPQKPGSSAMISKDGLMEGTVGGGLVEHQVQEKAKTAMKLKESCYCSFDLNDDILEEDSVICGGGMSILLDAAPEKHQSAFKALAESLNKRTAGVLVTNASYNNSGELNLERFWISSENAEQAEKDFTADIAQEIKEMLKSSVSTDLKKIITEEQNFIILEHIIPLPRLIIAGAGHIGKALAHYGKLLDFEVLVWDDRKEFANEKNIPDADLVLSGNMKEVLGKIKAGRDTYIAIVTRGHKQDAEVLKEFIDTGAGYIGMIGSRKKVAQVRDQFLKKGWSTAARWEELHAPIGIDIHSKSVQEIALSIAAELVRERYNLNQKNG